MLLNVSARLKEGDFCAHVAHDRTGLAAKAADGLNEVILAGHASGAGASGEVAVLREELDDTQRLGSIGPWLCLAPAAT